MDGINGLPTFYSGFDPGRKTAKKPMNKIAGDTGDFHGDADDPASWGNPVSSTRKENIFEPQGAPNAQIVPYQASKSIPRGPRDQEKALARGLSEALPSIFEKNPGGAEELPHGRLVELMGFTLRTAPGA